MSTSNIPNTDQKSKYDKRAFIILGLLFLILIAGSFLILDKQVNANEEDNFLFRISAFVILFCPSLFGSKPTLKYLNTKQILSKDILSRTIRNIILALLLTLFTFVLVFVFRNYIINNPDDNPYAIHKFIITLLTNVFIIQFIEYYYFFVTERNRMLIKEREEKEILILKNDVFREQMNPHFLFNSLNVLSSLIYIDQEKANIYTKELSKLYRYILNANHLNLINLESELKFIQSYFYILKLRFNTSVNLNVHQKTVGLNGYIVPLTLQLLIENAQKHNAFNKDKPLEIDIEITENSIIVINSLQTKNGFVESSKLGLKYIKTLYADLDKTISIQANETTFVVKIPIIKENV